VKLYIAGPMTGLPNFNRPAFNVMAEKLRLLGHDVLNPAELDTDETAPPAEECYRRDLVLMLQDREGVVVLPGWERSRGATAEVFNMNLIGKPVYRLVEGSLVPVPPTSLPQLLTL
jgi:hypothetical protein